MISAAQSAAVDPGTLPAAWSPYLAGALIGLLSCVSLAAAGRLLGASGAYAHVAGLLTRIVAPGLTRTLRWYAEHPPRVGFEVMLVLGIVPGAVIAAWTGGEITGRLLPPLWVERFGDTPVLRGAAGLLGGTLMGFGARLAGGCTSGHGISGALLLSVGSWIALLAFFAGGVLVAHWMYVW